MLDPVRQMSLILPSAVTKCLRCLAQDTLIPEGHNVLIFSQTRKMLNLIEVSCKVLVISLFPVFLKKEIWHCLLPFSMVLM